MFFSLTGCNKAEDGPQTETSAETEQTLPDTYKNIATDDTLDPENLEDNTVQGTKVKADELTSVTGQANGIDVSKWQGKIDWEAVSREGIDFAVIRVGYRGENGIIYRDSNADYNLQEAEKNGILTGVYFFSTAVNTEEAKEEALWVAGAVKGYKISYPVVYDCEGYTNPASRMYTLSASERTDIAISFLENIKAFGYEGMFYGSRSDMENTSIWDMTRIEPVCKVWVAQYTSPAYPETPKPDYTGKYHMWQYTNRGDIDGVEGGCDLVVSYFTAQEASAKDPSAKPAKAEAPKTAEELIYTEAHDSVTAKVEVNLRTAPSTKSDIVDVLRSGVFVKRTGIGKNGWSKLVYGGETVYAITSYLSTEVIEYQEPDIVGGMLFTAKSDRVTAKMEVNLRSLPTTDSTVLGVLKSGEFLDRSATSDGGWSRLTYNGQSVYAVTSYLTNEVVQIETSDIVENMEFTPQNDTVTAKIMVNLRSAPSTSAEIVGTLSSGEYAERTAVSNGGWSRLNYNGATVYAVTSYLTQ